jgi:hypothetical protein
MGTTANRSYPYPEGSDAVDVPGDVQALADAVDADLEAVDNAKADKTTTITAGTGLTGGGDLSANRTLAVSYGTTAGTAAQGNDARLSDQRVPTDNSVTSAKIVDGAIVNADINASAAIARTKIDGTPPPSSLTITAGTGLTGGGDLSANRTIGIANGGVGAAQLADGTITGAKFAAGLTYGAETASAPLGSELAGSGLTANLTGLTVGQTYQVGPMSGTLTGITLDGSALLAANSNSSFVATSTSHTVVASGGTAADVSVKQITGTSAAIVTFGGLPVRRRGTNQGVGIDAQRALTTGSQNTASGTNAQYSLTTGSDNTASGTSAQRSLTTGSSNTASGVNAQRALTTGSQNTASGYYAQRALTTGSSNTASGVNAQRALTTGSYNTHLGAGVGYVGQTATVNGTVAIGVDSTGTAARTTADDTIVLGTALHTLKVGAVSGASGFWALGVKVDGSGLTMDTTKYLTVKVDGVNYKLALIA